jgi:hypothetical protein
MATRIVLGCAAFALAACGADETAPSAEQNRALDEAAEMLNQAPNDLSRVDDNALEPPPDRLPEPVLENRS